jgi:hypothetical protein
MIVDVRITDGVEDLMYRSFLFGNRDRGEAEEIFNYKQ